MNEPKHSDRNACELTVVMPCLNEAETLEQCIRKAQGFLDAQGVCGEIVVAGTPAEVAAHAGSCIGQFLKHTLEQQPSNRKRAMPA